MRVVEHVCQCAGFVCRYSIHVHSMQAASKTDSTHCMHFPSLDCGGLQNNDLIYYPAHAPDNDNTLFCMHAALVRLTLGASPEQRIKEAEAKKADILEADKLADNFFSAAQKQSMEEDEQQQG